ncbi:MAG: hypothetical protein GC168_02375 [Candidatus Hydrogenedens sp.]|nr:hypothetical protein [Candidatus Hydrogenedens sp.]
MRNNVSRTTRRLAIHGWIWYLPAIVCVVGVLSFDTYLNVQKRRQDYEIAQLKERSRELNTEMLNLRSERAQREELNRLVEHAEAMGLREAGPGEIIRIAADFVEPREDVLYARATVPSRAPREHLAERVQPEAEGEAAKVETETPTIPVLTVRDYDEELQTAPRGTSQQTFESLDESLDKLLETL